MNETTAVPLRDGLLHDLLPTAPFLLRSGRVMLAAGIGCLLLAGLLAWLLPVPLEARIVIRAVIRTCGAIDAPAGTVLLVLHRRTRAFRRAGRAQETAALVVLLAGALALLPPALAAAGVLLELLIQLVLLCLVLLFAVAFAVMVVRRS